MSLRVIFGVLLTLAPVVWLGTRNLRAVPVGALLVALNAVFSFGILGLGGFTGRSATNYIAILGTLVVVLGIGFLIADYFSAPTWAGRVKWGVTSTIVWIVSIGLGITLVWKPLQAERTQVRRDASEMYWQETIRLAREESLTVERERPLGSAANFAKIERAIERVRALPMLPPARYIHFGDPVMRPDAVVVWAIVDVDPGRDFRRFDDTAWFIHEALHATIHRQRYPSRIGFGVVPKRIVDEAGGDSAYFGANGEHVSAQFHTEGAAVRLDKGLPLPLRR
jgi:hypothetical protein